MVVPDSPPNDRDVAQLAHNIQTILARAFAAPGNMADAQRLAQVIVDTAQGRLTRDGARSQLQENAALRELLGWLAQQPRTAPDSGDIITVGNISNSQAVAIGRGAIAIGSLTIALNRADWAIPFIPFNQNPDFVGRATELATLHTKLTDGTQQPVGIAGMAGTGKTQLAVAYAYAYRDSYPQGIVWLPANISLDDAFASLARQIHLDVDSADLRLQVQGALQWLHAHPDVLVILDNLAEPADLDRALLTGAIPAQLDNRILFTARRHTHYTVVELSGLAVDDALRLLLRAPARHAIRDDPRHPQRAAAHQIVTQLGGLPLALEIAGAHLGRVPIQPVQRYLDEIQQRRSALAVLTDPRARVFRHALPSQHEEALIPILLSQWEELRLDDSRLLLQAASQLPEAAILSIAFLGLLAGLSNDESFFGTPLDAALNDLVDASLLERLRADQVRLHPLIRDFAASRIADPLAFRRQCAANLLSAYQDADELARQCRERSLEAVQADIRSTRSFSEDATRDQLHTLYRLLQREAHTYRVWNDRAQPGFFLQQIHNQAALLGLEPLAASAAHRLTTHQDVRTTLIWYALGQSNAIEQTVTGFARAVTNVALSRDGATIIAGCGDGSITLHDRETGRIERHVGLHAGRLAGLIPLPDGQLVASAERIGARIILWDLKSGAVLGTLQHRRTAHNSDVRAIAVTPDGTTLIAASSDWTLRVWDLATGALTTTLGVDEQTAYGWLFDDAPLPPGISKDDVEDWRYGKQARGAILVGHAEEVLGVSVAADGRTLLSCAADGVIIVWDLHRGTELRRLVGHQGRVWTVLTTPDGARAVSASDDYTVRVWDLATGECLAILASHTFFVVALALTPDGKHAVSASADGTLKLWDLETYRECLTLTGHEDYIFDVVLTPDGRRAISGSEDRTLKVWDLAAEPWQAGPLMRTFESHAPGVMALAWSRDERSLIAATERSNEIIVWDANSGRLVARWHADMDSIRSIAVMPDGDSLAVAGNRSAIDLRRLATGELIGRLAGHEGRVQDLAITPDERLLVSASADATVRLWSLPDGKPQAVLRGHADDVNVVALTSDGRVALSGSDDDTIRVWDVSQRRLIATLRGHTWPVIGLAISHDDRLIYSLSWDETIRVWDLQTGKLLKTVPTPENIVSGSITALGAPMQALLSGDKLLALYDIATNRALQTYTGHTGVVWQTALTRDQARAATCSSDGTVRIWDMTTPAEPRRQGHRFQVNGITVFPDSRRAVSAAGGFGFGRSNATNDTTLKIWDLADGALLTQLTGHTSLVRQAAVTADGRQVISIADDARMCVWDATNGSLLAQLTGFHDVAYTLMLAADQDTIWTTGARGYVQSWSLARRRLLNTVQVPGAADGLAIASLPNGRILTGASDFALTEWRPPEDIKRQYALQAPAEDMPLQRLWFHPERMLALGATDRELCLWNLTNGALLHQYPDSNGITAATFTPDGQYVLAGDSRRILRVWDTRSGDCVLVLGVEQAISALAVTPQRSVVVGDRLGNVFCYMLAGLAPPASGEA